MHAFAVLPSFALIRLDKQPLKFRGTTHCKVGTMSSSRPPLQAFRNVAGRSPAFRASLIKPRALETYGSPLRLHQARRASSHARFGSSWWQANGRGSARAGVVIASGVAGFVLLNLIISSPLQLEAPPPASAQLGSESYESFRSDPATGTPVPVKLKPPPTALTSASGNLHLVGLGVRTVSFLKVRVYVAALYVDETAWKSASGVIKSDPSWSRFEKGRLLDSKGKGKAPGSIEGEGLMRTLMDAGVPCVIRIVPVRSTDFSHLRDGFTRTVQARLKNLRKSSPDVMTEGVEAHMSESVLHFKSIFPKASLPKGEALDLVFAPADPAAGKGQGPVGMSLSLEHNGQLLGRVAPPPSHLSAGKPHIYSVASELFLGYFADKDPISAPVSYDALPCWSSRSLLRFFSSNNR